MTPPHRRPQSTAMDVEVVERAALWRVVQMLPPGQGATIVLRFDEDLTGAQTADALGCSVGTVRRRRAAPLPSCVRCSPTRGTDEP